MSKTPFYAKKVDYEIAISTEEKALCPSCNESNEPTLLYSLSGEFFATRAGKIFTKAEFNRQTPRYTAYFLKNDSACIAPKRKNSPNRSRKSAIDPRFTLESQNLTYNFSAS